MKNKFFALLIVPLVILSLFSGLMMPAAHAQGITTPVPLLTPDPNNPDNVSLFQMRQGEVQLNGPYDSSTSLFGLPADWKLTEGAKLDLFMGVSFNTFAKSTTGLDPSVLQGGGTLTVLFNRITVGVFPLNTVGETKLRVDIPATALISPRKDGRMELSFALNSGISCTYSQQMIVLIHANSSFTLPHTTQTPDTSLLNFPQPLFQDSVFSDAALIVLPDQPSPAEMQSALTVSAGLGNLTGGLLVLDTTTVSKLTPEQQSSSNLIVVGKAASLPLLDQLSLPLAPASEQFALVGADDGTVQMVNSPWNPGKVVLVVTGNTDAGAVKAAQALSTGVLRPNTSPNLAVIDQVNPVPVTVSVPVDRTLADIAVDNSISVIPGRALTTLKAIGLNTASYRFYLPPGQTVAPDAYFELVFGHSALLDYARSGVVVLMNSQPIGSIRLTDNTAAQATNLVQMTIPSTAMFPGFNRLDIRAELVPATICTSPDLNGLWVSIWPESRLHLPLNASIVNLTSNIDLAAYPAPFVNDPTLATTAFVLQPNDLPSWQTAIRVAGFLGDRSNGALTKLAAFYGDNVPQEERAKYNLLVIGRPSQMPIIGEMNTSLPGPFDPASDVAIESNMQVTFRTPADAPTGYVEMFASPWNANNLVIAALGNSSQGVIWAASALVDAPLRSQLAGNFAAINDTQVVTTDTRLTQSPQNLVNPVDTTAIAASPIVDMTPPPVNRPAWIMPAIYVASALILLVLLVAVVGAFRSGRKGSST